MYTTEKIDILLIGNNPDDIRLVQELLSTACPDRFNVQIVNSLQAGLERIHENEFDAVLTDLFLPDAEGLNTVSNIQHVDQGLPIIVMGDQDSDELALDVVQLGAQDYLVKGQGDGHLISKAILYSIERKRVEQGFSFLVQYDNLTGLANRVLFRERLNRALIRADRNKKLVALMFIDLDRFKNINDTLGHDAGDQLLIEVGKRLINCTREGDTIARLGGDEFTIILEDVRSMNSVAVVARKIIDAMVAPFGIGGHELYITPSIGITMYPLDDTNEHNLLKNADTAMYRAKEQGRNGFQFYTRGMNTRSLDQLELEAKLRRALENDELVVHYQPKFDIGTNTIIGAEALIRWNHPDMGMVSPVKFIPLAEETGLIVPIGEWVLQTACRQNVIWQKQGYPPFRMAVNLSARQFKQSDIAMSIFESIIESDLLPQFLEVEITESMLMDDAEISNITLKEIKEHGVHVAIDDFGTGYSSLSYLKRFHIDTLKIDQSFVRDITEDADDAAIAKTIIALGHNLRLNVIAEGVETKEQLDFLYANGCNEAQGYFFSRPLPADEFTKLLQEQSTSHVEPIMQSA